MKALTIRDPWAQLLVCGVKRYETRSRATRYRGPVAIHAGKAIETAFLREIRDEPDHPFRAALEAAEAEGMSMVPRDWPRGCVIATANLVGCYPMEVDAFFRASVNGARVSDIEETCGHFEEGRWAWEFADIKRIDPVPVRGALGLWEWER